MSEAITITRKAKDVVKSLMARARYCLGSQARKETDALYRLLYQLVHDKEQSLDLTAAQTRGAFACQWKDLPQGNALLSDPWFKDNVTRILTEEEILIQPKWFEGKEVLDAGCGNGRWSYGLAKLGANITAVDVNKVALEETERALKEFSVHKEFVHTPLENLSHYLSQKKFDLVFSWGVIHHCGSFNRALHEVTDRVKEGGVLYLYLYGRESIPFKQDLELFKERIHYNSLSTGQEQMAFLLKKAGGDRTRVHNYHDLYAPLINRRLTFEEVRTTLQDKGFQDIVRTINHTELFIRAFKGPNDMSKWLLPSKPGPYWFQRYF